MEYNLYLNSMSYPKNALHVRFASGQIRLSPRQRARRTIDRIWGQPTLEIAELLTFVDQFKENTDIVFHGGDTPTLIDYLNYDTDWLNHLDGKNLWGISAGISMMAYRSFNIDHRFILNGFNLMPFQTVVHYNQGMNWMVDELYRECGLPVLGIRDDREYRVKCNDYKFALLDITPTYQHYEWRE